jgi:excisionase family DNA binding protein
MHCICKAYTVPMNAPVRHGENWSCPVPGALSVRDASLQLGVSTSTIRRRIDDGELRSFRIGGAIRIPTSEIARVRGDIGVARKALANAHHEIRDLAA